MTTTAAASTSEQNLPPWLRPPRVCPRCGNPDVRTAGPYEDGTGKLLCGVNGCGYSSRVAPPPGPTPRPAVFHVAVELEASTPDEVARSLRSVAATFAQQSTPLAAAEFRPSGCRVTIRPETDR